MTMFPGGDAEMEGQDGQMDECRLGNQVFNDIVDSAATVAVMGGSWKDSAHYCFSASLDLLASQLYCFYHVSKCDRSSQIIATK